MSDPLVVVVRHAEVSAENEKQQKISGWTDKPLDAKGKKQAEQLAETIVKRYHPTLVWSSDLTRARQTAKEIVEECKEIDGYDAKLKHTSDLRSWNLGAYQGKPAADVRDEVASLMAHSTVKAPGGESYGRFTHRFLSVMRSILAHARQSKEPTVVVTHTRSMLALRGWLKAGQAGNEVDPKAASGGSRVGAGTGVVLTLSRGRWKSEGL